MEGYRTYKNNVMFLVADEDQVERMVEVSQRYLAAQRIVGDADRMQQFNNEQADKLKKMTEAAELDLRVAITKAYRHFYYPSADASRKAANLAYLAMQPDEQGDIEKDQTDVVLRILRNLDKVLTADQEKPLSPQYVKAKAWPANTVSMTTEDLRRAFAQRLGLKMLLDINQLKRTIKDGVAKGTWVYYPPEEGIAYGPPSPAPMIQIGEDATLYTPEEARRLGLKIKGVDDQKSEVCPVCGKTPCTCDEEVEPKEKSTKFCAEGGPAQVFQSVADQCHDNKVASLKRMFIRIDGMGKDVAKDVRSMGLAVPQMGKANFTIEQKMVLEFGGGEKLAVDFIGAWDRYKRLKTVTDPLSQEATNASIKFALRADFEQGLEPNSEQFQTIRDVLANLGMGRIRVDADEKGSK